MLVGGCRGSLCEKRWGAVLCRTQMVLAGAIMDPDESISQAGVTSVKAYLRAKTSEGQRSKEKE